jgi:hypothetical protein
LPSYDGKSPIVPASDGSAYKEYVLTDKGREIFPVVVSMRQWGERFLLKREETRSVLLDNEFGQPLMPQFLYFSASTNAEKAADA